MKNFFKKFKKSLLIIFGILVLLLVLSQTTVGRQIDIPARILEAFQNLFQGQNEEMKLTGVVENYGPDEYWVYVKPEDEITTPDMISGRTQKGDIVDIISLSRGNGAYNFSKEFLIVRVKGLTPELISKLMERYIEGEEQKAERKYRLDLDSFKSQNDIPFDFGTAVFTIKASDIILIEKTQAEIISYQRRAEFYAKTEWLRKLARSFVLSVFAATINTRYVDPDAAAGGNGTTNALSGANCAYQSLALWEDARDGNLLAPNDYIEEAIVDSNGVDHTADGTAVIILGWTTGPDNYVSVKSAVGSRASKSGWNVSKYRSTNSLTIQANYVRIDGLQFSYNVNWSGSIYLNSIATSSDIRISNCRISNGNVNTSGIISADSVCIVKIWNCIIENGQGGLRFGIYAQIGGTINVYNSVVYGASNDGYRRDAGQLNVTNSVVFNSVDDWEGTITADYCASDDGGGTNEVAESGGGASWPNDFTDAANGDFTLLPTSALVDAGLNDPASGLFSDDIDGQTRPFGTAWDIGADEVPFCGDGACNGSETCVSCPADCGTCKVILKRDVILRRNVIFGRPAPWACGDTVTFTYNGVSVTYGTASSTGKCWLDRNLGASKVATSSTDSAAYGDLFQWGREDDGHQVRSPAPANTEGNMTLTTQPGNAIFIKEQTSPYDWATTTWITRWTVADDDPCPSGWRVPTNTEWDNERLSWSPNNNAAGAFASPLKLTLAGYRDYSDASLITVASYGSYWSSVATGGYAYSLYFHSGGAGMSSDRRAYGFSVRCVQD